MIDVLFVCSTIIYILVATLFAGYFNGKVSSTGYNWDLGDVIIGAMLWGVWVPVYIVFFKVVPFILKPVFRMGAKFRGKNK